jgi:predicted RNA-binding protein with PUA-like domain
MSYFLAKTDPDTYSLADFEKEGETLWDGVHSNAAINFIKQMKPGDLVYIYESQGPKAIAGLAEVTTAPRKNEADPRPSWVVDMKFVKKFTRPATLAEIKATPALANFKLVRESRLSVMPVSDEEQKILESMLA